MVHLVAPGDELILANSMAAKAYDQHSQGTSFAAPQVAGGVALMASASHALEARGVWSAIKAEAARDSRVVKAVLMNSASKLPGWDNGQQVQPVLTRTADGRDWQWQQDVVTTKQGLDYVLGAGALDLSHAYEQYVTNESWALDSVRNGTFVDYRFDETFAVGATVTVTLAWHAVYSDYQDAKVNDGGYDLLALANLNLEVWSLDSDGGFDLLLGTSRTTYDTTEHVYMMLEADTRLGLRVSHEGMLFDLRGSPLSDVTTYGLAWHMSAIASVPEPWMCSVLLGAGALLLAATWKSTAGKKSGAQPIIYH